MTDRETVLSDGCQSIVSFIPVSVALEYKRDKGSIIRKGSGEVEVCYGIQETSACLVCNQKPILGLFPLGIPQHP